MAAVNPVAGSNISPVPAPVQQTVANNYLDFSTGWAQQYLPELYEAEVERYGNRTLSGLLAKVGAEEAMASDQVVWSEQGRLHISVETAASADIANDNITLSSEADANLLRINDTVVLYALGGTGTGKTLKGIVTAAPTTTKRTIIPYTQATMDATGGSAVTFGTNTIFRVLVYGTEFKKGDGLSHRNSLTPSFVSLSNKPIILRDKYAINGSDAAQIGWVEVSGEEGQSGYLWYLKAEGDTRARFNDYLEMSMLEAERATGAQLDTFLGTGGSGAGAEAGTEGLFQAITDRGHVCTDTFTGVFADDMGTIDNILVKFDGQGAIEENMMYLNRSTNVNLDDTLGNIGAGYAAAAGFGMFNNSADMALNLGFSGFRRGSYDFYKTDWKYLNDTMAYGSFTEGAGNTRIAGAIMPAGVSSVYDQGMGRNVKRPFLHVRYRASANENRKLKTWVTGSVGGNITSDIDEMQVNYLSERCLVVQAANNFMLLKQ